jgi:hypothetical protein
VTGLRLLYVIVLLAVCNYAVFLPSHAKLTEVLFSKAVRIIEPSKNNYTVFNGNPLFPVGLSCCAFGLPREIFDSRWRQDTFFIWLTDVVVYISDFRDRILPRYYKSLGTHFDGRGFSEILVKNVPIQMTIDGVYAKYRIFSNPVLLPSKLDSQGHVF